MSGEISSLGPLAGADIVAADEIEILDKSDTSMSANGTNKRTALIEAFLAFLSSNSILTQSLTGSQANSLINAAATWNTSGTPTLIKANVTDTASNAASKLLDLQVGGASKFAVTKVGGLELTGPSSGSCVIASLTQFRNCSLVLGVNMTGGVGAGFSSSTAGTSPGAGAHATGFDVSTSARFGFTSGTITSSIDALLTREAAGVIAVRGSSGSVGGALSFLEQTAPAAPASNIVRIYAQDNGAGKTQLMALFATGAAQQIAIEP